MPMRVLAALLLGLFFALPAVAGPDEPTPAPEPGATGPGPAGPAAPDASEREIVLGFVEELRADAARLRGLEWKETIPADLLSREQLRANFIAMIEKETTPEELERDTRVLRRMGLLGPDEDPMEMMLEAMEEMVGGYYDPDEKKLFLIEGMTGEAQKPVILHELIHALEDQYVDLRGRIEPLEDDPDRLFAEKCIGEGSAELARQLYQKENPEVARLYEAAQRDPEMMRKQLKIMSKIPAFLILPTLLHYQLGPAFVTRALGEDLAGGMDAIYETPPESQEQLLHPVRWFGQTQDFPQTVAWGGDFAAIAGEGWEKLHDLSVGELDLAVYLDFFLGATKGRINMMLMAQGKMVVPEARKAAEGWDAGQVYFMEKEGLPAAWIEALAFDSVEDATEAADALLRVLEKVGCEQFADGEIEDATEPGGHRRVVSYTGPYGPGRLLQRDDQIVLVDGVPEEHFDAVWTAATATTFVRDERDTWDPTTVEDVFAGCDWVDKESGLGLHMPSDAWTATAASGQPGLVATVEKDGLSVIVLLIPMAPSAVRPMLEQQMRVGMPDVDVDGATDLPIAGADGRRYLGDGKALYLGGNAGQTLVFRATGEAAAVEAALEDLNGMAASAVLTDN